MLPPNPTILLRYKGATVSHLDASVYHTPETRALFLTPFLTPSSIISHCNRYASVREPFFAPFSTLAFVDRQRDRCAMVCQTPAQLGVSFAPIPSARNGYAARSYYLRREEVCSVINATVAEDYYIDIFFSPSSQTL
jgi:hypothetical protein